MSWRRVDAHCPVLRRIFVSNKNLCLRLELNLSLCSVKFLISSVLEAGYDTSEDWIKDMIPIYSMCPLDVGLIIYITVKFCACTLIPRIYNSLPWIMVTLPEYKLAALAKSYHYHKWIQEHFSEKITGKSTHLHFLYLLLLIYFNFTSFIYVVNKAQCTEIHHLICCD